MKYLIAYKPCGCRAFTIDPINVGTAERLRRDGYELREEFSNTLPDSSPFCLHGTVTEQLTAKLASLRTFLAAELAKLPATSEWDPYMEGKWDGKSEAYRSVLAELDRREGNGNA